MPAAAEAAARAPHDVQRIRRRVEADLILLDRDLLTTEKPVFEGEEARYVVGANRYA